MAGATNIDQSPSPIEPYTPITLADKTAVAAQVLLAAAQEVGKENGSRIGVRDDKSQDQKSPITQPSPSVKDSSFCHPELVSGSTSSIDYTELAAMIREEVNAANAEWLAGLAQGLQAYAPQPTRNKNIYKVFLRPPSANPRSKPFDYAQGERWDTPSDPLIPSQTRDDDDRYLEGSSDGNTFPLFAFGDRNHAYVAGDNGLWQVQVKATASAGGGDSGGDDDEDVEMRHTKTRAGASISTNLTQLAKDKIMLNNQANTTSPIKHINKLALYGQSKWPVVSLSGSDAGGDDGEVSEEEMRGGSRAPSTRAPSSNNSAKIYAMLDDSGTKFATNDTTKDESKLYDTTPLAINQPVVGLTASRAANRFFVAVADAGEATRTIYKRSDKWDTETVRKAIIDGMKIIKKNGGGDLDKAQAEAIATITPTEKPAAGATENYVQAVIKSVGNALFLSELNADTKKIYEEYAKLAFRDAINLRKGGLLDLAAKAETKKKSEEILAKIDSVNGIQGQAKPADPAPTTFEEKNENDESALAAAIQVGLGWGIRNLAKKFTEDDAATFVASGDQKPFTSLDSRKAKVEDATKNLNLYTADQDGGSRGICVAEIKSDGSSLITKNDAGDFLTKPGTLITKAMYEGIALNEEHALAQDFGKLEEVGIPCAVYSAADSNPATRAIFTGNVDLCYDDQLNRLFVGFEDITLGDNVGTLTNGSGAVCSVMVGQEKTILAKPSLYFQPIIANLSPLLFQSVLNPDAGSADAQKKAAETDYMVGFYQQYTDGGSAANDLHASAKKLQVMHTSTGKDYLVFNGGVAKQAQLSSLGSKMYALPLVGSYDKKLNDVAAAGQLARAKRPTGPEDFYKKGLKEIDFLNPIGVVGDGDGNTGIVDTTADNSTLSKLHTTVTGYVKAILQDWGTANPQGTDESKALWNKIKAEHPDIQAGLATLALQSSYVKTAPEFGIPDVDAAATQAWTKAVGDYNKADPKEIKASNLLEKIEQAGIDIAVPAGAADRAKTQGPAYDVARYTLEQNIKDGTAENSLANLWTNKIKADHARRFGDPADNLKVETGKINGADAGGIAGGVAAVEGSLAWSLRHIYDVEHGGANKLNEQKLIPAIQTMHADAPYAAFDYVRVGNNPQLLSYDTSARVQDVQVVGDTVYVSLGNTRDANHVGEAGIFASTAIFNETGFVRSWTPWKRMQGHTQPVAGAAFDPQTSRYWYTTNKDNSALTGADATIDAARVTAWGKGFTSDTLLPENRLSAVLDTVFGDIGGMFGLFTFGPDTPGFKPRNVVDSLTPANRHEQFAMMVATGNGRVALIKTGMFDQKDKIFKPTENYSTLPGQQNVFVFDAAISAANNNYAGTALAELGIITCAEVSRLPLADSPNDKRGWLFVGGTGGLAVLTRWNTGMGWNTGTAQGLSNLLPGAQRDDFPGGSGWRFMQILDKDGKNPFTDVRKLVSDGSRYLYVLTAKAVWRIDMAAVPRNNQPPYLGGVPNGRTSQSYGIFKRKQYTKPQDAPANNEYIVILDNDNYVHKIMDVTAQTTASVNVFADKEAAQFFDMLIGYRQNVNPAPGAPAIDPGKAATDQVQDADAKTQLIVATTAGLFYNDNTKQFADTVASAATANSWTQLKAAGAPTNPADQAIAGPIVRLEFISSQPGDTLKKAINPATVIKSMQSYADGNLHVTAFSADKKELLVYRFNLSAQDWEDPEKMAITPFQEPYHISGDATKTTPYFYKVGQLNAGDEAKIEFGGPVDYFARSAHVTGSANGFAQGVWITPQPEDFLRDEVTNYLEDIDLGYDLTLPLYLGNTQIEPASGAQLVSGEFGVRVND